MILFWIRIRMLLRRIRIHQNMRIHADPGSGSSTLCLAFVISIVCFVQCLLCLSFVISSVFLCLVLVMSSVYYAQCLLCLVFAMYSVCYVLYLLSLVFVMSSVCYVYCLSCPVFVCPGLVISSVCLSRVYCFTNTRHVHKNSERLDCFIIQMFPVMITIQLRSV